jgi:Protein of unknown function with HXXEE motif
VNVGTIAFVVIVLFTVHEFEEIILVVPWIARHTGDPRFARDTWISRRAAYPSTEVIAAAIAEGIVLASLILAIAVSVGAPSVVIAVATINSVHLLGHLRLAGRVRAWNPGSVTSAVTLPLNVALIVWALIHGVNLERWLTVAVLIGVVFAANLKALHGLAPLLQQRLGHSA